VLGDLLYGTAIKKTRPDAQDSVEGQFALRAVALIYPDPFQKRTVRIEAPREEFCEQFGFASGGKMKLRPSSRVR